MKNKKLYLGLLVGTMATGLLVNQAEAVPSFARQTGMACAACHTVFPELNSFGRSFKLNGYTLTGIKQVEAKETSAASSLQFNQIPPLSAMLVVSAVDSKANKPAPSGPSTSYSLPDELSFFFAGEISPHMGSFIQMTMEQGTGFALDNTDIRYANHAGNVTYGFTLNNSPTVQDLWNSTPTWGFPFTHGYDAASIAPVVADGLGQNVIGLGAYADWGNGIYTELTLYRNTNTFDAFSGYANPVAIDGAAPYVRLAWNKTFSGGDYLMIGAYGMSTKLVDSTTYTGANDKYDDTAIDAQYEHQMGDNMISVHASYTNEKQTLDLSGGGTPTLKTTKLDAIYHWGYHATATLGYLNNSGADGAYDDTAYIGQFSYLPWQNTKFTAQYVSYSKVGGVTDNASDNNTLLLQAWLMW